VFFQQSQRFFLAKPLLTQTSHFQPTGKVRNSEMETEWVAVKAGRLNFPKRRQVHFPPALNQKPVIK